MLESVMIICIRGVHKILFQYKALAKHKPIEKNGLPLLCSCLHFLYLGQVLANSRYSLTTEQFNKPKY